jgi:hypothetical protein
MSEIIALDSATKLDERHRDLVVVGGSHGGLYPGWLAAKYALRAVILCDAGVGKDRAGIGSLDYLDACGIPAATLDYRSARIADGADQLARGIVSHVNALAAALGCKADQTCLACAEILTQARTDSRPAPEPYAEARHRLHATPGEAEVWGIDSVALMTPDDRGRIMVTGSHGGLLGGRDDGIVIGPPLAATFNDAGVGADNAGIARLPVLDRMGIAAVTVAADSARIGDARSAWQTGRVSHANRVANEAGVEIGDGLPTMARKITAHGST